jgi:hypothetical protein
MKQAMRCFAAILAIGLGCVSAAHATLVTEWTYYDEIGFSDYSGSGITTSGYSGDLLGLPTTLQWGYGGRNSLTTHGNQTGTVSTFGTAPGAGLVSYNAVNPSSYSLESATLRNIITLTPTAPTPPFDGGFTLPGPTLEFDLLFSETENHPRSGICADGTSVFDHINVRGCRDIFALANPQALQPLQFAIDDFLYTIAIFAPGVGPLLPAACAAVGLDPGCIGLMTRENASTTFMPYFFIGAQPASQDMFLAAAQIAEPQTAGLLALALAAFGVAYRRRKG